MFTRPDASAGVYWSPEEEEEVGSNASEGLDLVLRQEQAGKEEKLPSSMALILGFRQKVWPRFEGVSSHLQGPD